MADNIQVTGIELDTRRFEDAIRRAERRIDELEDNVDRSGKAAKRAEGDFNSWGRAILGVAAAYGAFRVAQDASRFVFATNVEFEKLEATLRTVTGSAQAGADAFRLITDFAVTTPFEVQNLTDSFIALRARGLDPTEDRLRGLGNFASAFTRDISELTNAIISGASGMSLPLRRFGVDAAREGDRITLTFGDITREVDATVDAISAFFAEIGNTQFADAMSQRMDTMDGAISNLKDSSALLAREIGKAGLNGEINDLVRTLDAAIQDGEKFADTLGGALASGVRGANAALEVFIEHQDTIILGLQVLVGASIGQGLLVLTRRLTSAAGAAGGLRAALLGINPVTLLAAFVGAAAAVEFFRDKEAAASETTRTLARDLDGLRESLDGLTDAQITNRFATLQASFDALTIGVAEAEQKLRAAREADTGGGAFRVQQGAEQAGLQATIEDLKRQRELVDAAMGDLISFAAGRGGGSDTSGGDDPADTAAAATDEFAKMRAALERQRIELEEGERAAFAYELSLSNMTDAQQTQVLALWDGVQALDARAEAEKKAEQEAAANERAVESTLEQLRAQNLELAYGKEALLRWSLASKKATDEQIEAAVAFNRANEALEERNRKADEAARKAEQLAQAEAQHLKTVGDRLAQDLTDPLFDFIEGTKDAGEAFTDMVDSFLRDLVRLTLQKALTDALATSLANALGNAFGGTPQPTVGGYGAHLPTGTLDSGVMSAQASGGTNVFQTNNFNVTAMDAQDVNRALRKGAPEIVSIVGEAVRDSDATRQHLLGG